MSYALISPNEGNRICDVEVVEFPVAAPLYWVQIPDGQSVNTTWTFDGSAFHTPVPQPPQPIIVTPFQFKAALIKQGLYDQVQTAVNGADQLTQLAWNTAQQFIENDPMITTLAAALGLQNQIHVLFQFAETLQA